MDNAFKTGLVFDTQKWRSSTFIVVLLGIFGHMSLVDKLHATISQNDLFVIAAGTQLLLAGDGAHTETSWLVNWISRACTYKISSEVVGRLSILFPNKQFDADDEFPVSLLDSVGVLINRLSGYDRLVSTGLNVKHDFLSHMAAAGTENLFRASGIGALVKRHMPERIKVVADRIPPLLTGTMVLAGRLAHLYLWRCLLDYPLGS